MSGPSPAMVEQGGSKHQAQGRALLNALHGAAQALKLYPLENAVVQHGLQELHQVARQIVEREGSLELELVGDFLFLNDARLAMDLSNYLTFSSVNRLLARHRIGSLQVGPAATQQDWVPVLAQLLREPAEEDPFAAFVARLGPSAGGNIGVGPESDSRALPQVDDQAKAAAKRTYTQSVQVAREVLTDVRLERAVNARRVKRVVQGMVEQVLNNETAMVGMTTLRDYDEYTFTHCVNVCIFSLVLGQKLGLSKHQLYQLGVSALFHDIGKMRIDPELTHKVDQLTEQDWAHIQEHPTEGLLSLFSLQGFGEVPYRAMLVAYEHHMKEDLKGYPSCSRPRRQSLFSRIVAVADGFDAATSHRSYQALPWRPEDVLKEMRDNRERGYDPVLVKAFVNVTGIFPVGTLVLLDTHELAVVVAPNSDPELMTRPVVRLLSTPDGMMLAEPLEADLAEADPVSGLPRRTIIKTLDAEKYGIKVAEHFI